MQDIEDFISGLPKKEQVILRRLRDLIFQAEPRLRVKLSYGVPYFFRHRRVFFLWPASVPGLNHKSASPAIALGFCYGYLLSNVQGLLSAEGRKQVYTMRIASLQELDEAALLEVLHEAVLVDHQFFSKY